MLPLALLLFLLGAVCLWWAGRARRQSGIPRGRLIELDHRQLQPVAEPMFDPQWRLTGRPDALLEREGGLIPVELKSGGTPTHPYMSHIMQLMAYCRLVHQGYGSRPAYGVIGYPGRSYQVDYTPRAERMLREVVNSMREGVGAAPDRSHEDPARCRGCGYRRHCDQSLAG